MQKIEQRLTELIAARYPDRRERPGYGRLASEICEATGGAISGTYLWQLATGKKRNPTLEQLDVLAEFFDVPIEYFYNDAVAADVRERVSQSARSEPAADTETEESALLRQKLAEQDVQMIAMRAGSMSPALRQQLLKMMESLDPTPPRNEDRQ
ncbi:helix-turn-helix domain-containing protein [Nocardia sp. CA-128927]|uniref:helix-turn-helix domain-containing protein n=1 Tax=Nocardia sp. CA-128927 TaxID=3239975 RepID=UPI003D99E9AA